MRATDFDKAIAKRSIAEMGISATLTHFSGTPTWGGEYDQTLTYESGVSVIPIRVVPIREELVLGDQTYGAEDLRGWVAYDVDIGISDELNFSGTKFDGDFKVGNILDHDTSQEVLLKRIKDVTDEI